MKLVFEYAPMSAGKSAQLLIRAHGFEEQGLPIKLFTAAVDDRSGRGTIATRIGHQREASIFAEETRFTMELVGAGVRAVFVDEAQFLTQQQAIELHQLAHVYGVKVYAYGLRTTFTGVPFAGAASLLALADELNELTAICKCGADANMSIRLDDEGRRIRAGQTILIGGSNRYRSVCGDCFHERFEEGVRPVVKA